LGNRGLGSVLHDQPFPDPDSPNQASPTRFSLAGLPESRMAVPLMLGALRRRATQAAMRFAGPPRVDATQCVRVVAPTSHDTRLRPRNGARATNAVSHLYNTRRERDAHGAPPGALHNGTALEARRAQDGGMSSRTRPAHQTRHRQRRGARGAVCGPGRHSQPFVRRVTGKTG
jgi:hypothetical protein